MTMNFHSNTEALFDIGICIERKFCFLLRRKRVCLGYLQREREGEREREREREGRGGERDKHAEFRERTLGSSSSLKPLHATENRDTLRRTAILACKLALTLPFFSNSM